MRWSGTKRKAKLNIDAWENIQGMCEWPTKRWIQGIRKIKMPRAWTMVKVFEAMPEGRAQGKQKDREIDAFEE